METMGSVDLQAWVGTEAALPRQDEEEMEEDLIRRLHSEVVVHRSELLGCMRRNRQTAEDIWRLQKNNAFLLLMGGQKIIMETPIGPAEAVVINRGNGFSVMSYRAGQWQDYWLEDLTLERDIVSNCTSLNMSPSDVLVWEYNGELNITYHPAAPHGGLLMARAVAGFNASPTVRIPKNTHRALRTCRYCPIKRLCDATDRERGEDNDWHKEYPYP